jgi:NADPH:quinone reductase
VDGVLDPVGGDYLGGDIAALAEKGRVLLVGLVAGARHTLDLRAVLNRRATIIGTVLRARSRPEKIAATRAFAADVLPLLADGTAVPIIDEVLPLAEAARAHEIMAENRNYGRIVLQC